MSEYQIISQKHFINFLSSQKLKKDHGFWIDAISIYKSLTEEELSNIEEALLKKFKIPKTSDLTKGVRIILSANSEIQDVFQRLMKEKGIKEFQGTEPKIGYEDVDDTCSERLRLAVAERYNNDLKMAFIEKQIIPYINNIENPTNEEIEILSNKTGQSKIEISDLLTSYRRLKKAGQKKQKRRKNKAKKAKTGETQDGTAQDETAQDGTIQDGTIQDKTAQDGTVQDETAQDETVQDGTVQDETAQDGTAQAARVKEKYYEPVVHIVYECLRDGVNPSKVELYRELKIRTNKSNLHRKTVPRYIVTIIKKYKVYVGEQVKVKELSVATVRKKMEEFDQKKDVWTINKKKKKQKKYTSSEIIDGVINNVTEYNSIEFNPDQREQE